jgi:excinuclease ABC subunit C
MSALSDSRPDGQFALFEAAPGIGTSPLRDHVRTHARNVPGIYRMRAASGALLYVGRSRQLRTRLLSYFRAGTPDEKSARLLAATRRIEWDELPSEFDAVVRECRLIRAHLPPFNREMARPSARFWVVYATKDAAPRLRVSRITALPRDGTGPLVGPFTQPRLVRDAVRVLNDALGLRDCPDQGEFAYADDDDLFLGTAAGPSLRSATPRCHRFETRRCLGPCIAAPPQHRYTAAMEAALAYLAGANDRPAAELREALAAASAELAFERAGWLRNRLATLASLEEQLARIRTSIGGPTGFYLVTGAPGADRIVALADGAAVGEVFTADHRSHSALAQTLAQRVSRRGDLFRPDHFEEMLSVSRWFATHPAESERVRPSIEEALRVARGQPVDAASA